MAGPANSRPASSAARVNMVLCEARTIRQTVFEVAPCLIADGLAAYRRHRAKLIPKKEVK